MTAAGNMDHRISTKRDGRFNRRLGAHLARMPQSRAAHHRLLDHPEKEAYSSSFIADFDRTRLRCLDY